MMKRLAGQRAFLSGFSPLGDALVPRVCGLGQEVCGNILQVSPHDLGGHVFSLKGRGIPGGTAGFRTVLTKFGTGWYNKLGMLPEVR